MAKLPQAVKNTLWSWDTNKIDLEKDKKLIVTQVLNYGTEEATDWLFDTYPKSEIEKEAQKIPLGQWDEKSLALWSLIMDLDPKPRSERILND
jgi:hypothetical protein